jgi:hypothetical protein
VLAPPAVPMCDAILRVAYSGLGAPLVLAPLASSMCLAVGRTSFSRLETALVLAAFAYLHAPCSTPCRLALALHSPPPHTAARPWPPPGSRQVGAAETPNHCDTTFTAVTHPPLSPQRSASAQCTSDITYTTVAVREQVRRWVQHVSVKMVNSAWAGDVRWMCSRAGWTGTPPHPPPPGSQAARPSCASPNPRMVGSKTRHTATRCPQHDGGTPWSAPAVLRVWLL